MCGRKLRSPGGAARSLGAIISGKSASRVPARGGLSCSAPGFTYDGHIGDGLIGQVFEQRRSVDQNVAAIARIVVVNSRHGERGGFARPAEMQNVTHADMVFIGERLADDGAVPIGERTENVVGIAGEKPQRTAAAQTSVRPRQASHAAPDNGFRARAARLYKPLPACSPQSQALSMTRADKSRHSPDPAPACKYRPETACSTTPARFRGNCPPSPQPRPSSQSPWPAQ